MLDDFDFLAKSILVTIWRDALGRGQFGDKDSKQQLHLSV